jgi:hypothetical protein
MDKQVLSEEIVAKYLRLLKTRRAVARRSTKNCARNPQEDAVLRVLSELPAAKRQPDLLFAVSGAWRMGLDLDPVKVHNPEHTTLHAWL